MGRYYTLLIIIIIGVLVAVVRPVAAQNGACPSGSFVLGTVGQWWPGATLACVYNTYHATIANEAPGTNAFPCDQWLLVRDSLLPENRIGRTIFIVPETTQDLTATGRVKFLLWFLNDPQILFPPDVRSKTYRLEYYNSLNTVTDIVTGDIADMPTVVGYYTKSGITRYYRVYLFEETFSTVFDGFQADGTGGYLQWRFTDEESTSYNIASLRLGNADESMPPHCTVPGAVLPFEPTPTLGPGTPSPTPTNTPQYPTAPPQQTIYPTPSLTPLSFSTIPPAPTFTPLAIPTLQSLVFPTLNVPTIEPVYVTISGSTTTATPPPTQTPIPTRDLSTIEVAVASFATQVSEPVNQSVNALTITSTANISSTSESLQTNVQYIGYPFRFAKAVRFYTPNTWFFWFALLSALFIVTFVYVAKVALAIISWAIEWIRRIWEAIPLN